MTTIFLHGLESSSQGTKATWLKKHFPETIVPDLAGPLAERMNTLRSTLDGKTGIILIGSSFGGLMAALFTQENPGRVKKAILLAPALNFPDYSKFPVRPVDVPVLLYIGSQDDVCPPDIVIPLAKRIFTNITVVQSDDDHLLHRTFNGINWESLLRNET